MNEWEFTQLAVTWMQQVIDADPLLPFRQARVEQTASGSAKRRDITLLNESRKPVLTGEVKMPYRPDGHSPFRREVVDDARAKAVRAGCEFCFTWNVNKLVLWPAKPRVAEGTAARPGADHYEAWDVVDVYRDDQMGLEATENRIKRFLAKFLRDAARYVTGGKDLGRRPPDDRFVDALEAALDQPVLLTTDALTSLWGKDKKARESLQAWMRDDQGWPLADPSDARGIADDLNHAARFANYALVNKLVFHEALVRRYPDGLHPAAVPAHINSGDQLRLHLEGLFARARTVTGDYETVFGEYDHRAIAPRIPFYADPAVAYWRTLVEQIHEFDFSRLDYEVIGTIFERLISPAERHKYGQYYTRAEVVDLLNSYAIRTGREKLMDPACGGGTFLVRAYARKRELQPGEDHSSRLRDLFGVDQSRFAAHLTTINLATRDLQDRENYPQVARSDFFDVEPGRSLMNLPARVSATGLGRGQMRSVEIPPLDAVVGNPPYVRQEDITAAPKKKGKKTAGPPPGTKEFYQQIALTAAGGLKLSGRSDLHVYFWPHAAEFLHDGGRLCFLTSSQWLDVDYGFRLQEYILRNFEIEAVYESLDEPWFVGARVVTCATILRRQRIEIERMNHIVRFVQLRRPIIELLTNDGTTAGAVAAADNLRDKIEGLQENYSGRDFRVRLINQGDLWRNGVALGQLLSRGKPSQSKKHAAQPAASTALRGQQGERYVGGKWGQYVRAPDFWFELIDRCGAKLVPLAKVAQVRFGVKTGSDGFFLPVDASEAELKKWSDPSQFEEQHGVGRAAVESGQLKVVRCGEKLGEMRVLEASVLEPEVHNLKDVKGFVARAKDCRRLMLMTGRPATKLPEHAAAYVAWGNQIGIPNLKTVAGRVSEKKEWHDLTGHRRGAMFWSKAQQYRHVIPLNSDQLQCNCNLYDVTPREKVDDDVYRLALNGVLNSTLSILSKTISGRPVGVEGNLKTEVVDVNMMPVPDVEQASLADRKRVASAMEKMKRRKPLDLISPREFSRSRHEEAEEFQKLESLSDKSELDESDRRELDDAVLRMLGYGDSAERDRLLNSLYAYLRQHFIDVRQKEIKANKNKKKSKKRGGRDAPRAIAELVLKQLRERTPGLFRLYPSGFVDGAVLSAMGIDTYDLPLEGDAELTNLLTANSVFRITKGKRVLFEQSVASREQGQLLLTLFRENVRGLVVVPHDAAACVVTSERFRAWIEERDSVLSRLLEENTADDDSRDKVRELILPALQSLTGGAASRTAH